MMNDEALFLTWQIQTKMYIKTIVMRNNNKKFTY